MRSLGGRDGEEHESPARSGDGAPVRGVLMHVVDTIAGLRRLLGVARTDGKSIGFVPTMGALHEGHGSLIRAARARDDVVVVSIFVNPLQFNRPDDLAGYPRTFEADRALCDALGADIVFAPGPEEMYPEPQAITMRVGDLARFLCGASRPGHFDGVATVVMKLFQIVQPDRAYFGEKDAQQLAIIRRLVADFHVPVTIVGMPTVRSAEGLALSSRNAKLSEDGRRRALVLHRALERARTAIASGRGDVEALLREAASGIPAGNGLELDYLEAVDPLTLQPLTSVRGPVLLAGALWVDGVRLIDNVTATPGAPGDMARP